MNQQTIKGNWNQVKGKITEKWGDVSDQELEQAQGNMQQVIGMIQEKTGETKQTIESYLNSIYDNLPSTETVREYASAATENIQATAQQAADQVKAGYLQTERLVRERPIESVAICFGIGAVAGLVTGLLMRSK